jgi:hypothetical protein
MKKDRCRTMTTLIDFLQEMEQSRQAVVLPMEEVERLAKLFGPSVRSIGFWNKSGDGSVEIPMNNVTEAARALDNASLAQAVLQLKSSGQFAEMMDHSLASQFIETLASLYLRQFQDRVQRYQETGDPAEADRLWNGVARDLFGA